MKSIKQIVNSISFRIFYYCYPDKVVLNRKFKEIYGRDIDWENPKTFNEKIQWLKVYDRNPDYRPMVDKYEVRKIISDKLGEEYLFPLVGGPWNSVEEIDFDSLPEQFVLKCTHDSASVIICKDKNNFDFDGAKKTLKKCLKRNFYYVGREHVYENLKPRIIAEKYMVDESGSELKDYKFLCFNGEVKCFYVVRNRGVENEGAKLDYYDVELNHLDIRTIYPNSDKPLIVPENFSEMISIAESLSKGFKFIRIDLYNVNGKIYFGEYTFYDGSGFCKLEPYEWEEKLGDFIKLD